MKFMLPISRGSSTVNHAIGRILSSLISKDVQLLYSGVGRETKGKAKLNFSQTSVYTCMTGTLIYHHATNFYNGGSKFSYFQFSMCDLTTVILTVLFKFARGRLTTIILCFIFNTL